MKVGVWVGVWVEIWVVFFRAKRDVWCVAWYQLVGR